MSLDLSSRSGLVAAALALLCSTAACGDALSLSERGCAADGDCVEGNRCDPALPGGRCRPACDGGCAAGDGCDRGFCVPGFSEGCEGCTAAGYECREPACVPSSMPLALVTPGEATAVAGSRLVLDGSGSSSPTGEPLRFRWEQRLPAGAPDLVGGGAVSPLLAIELPPALPEPIVIALTVTGEQSGLSSTAEARITVASGAVLTVTLTATREDGSPVGDATPALEGERVQLSAAASGGSGARITSLQTGEPGWVDEDPEPARFSATVPGGCLAPPLFTATAADDAGGAGSATLILPVARSRPEFAVATIVVTPLLGGKASVAVTGAALDEAGSPDPALASATRLFVETAGGDVELAPGAAGWGGDVPLPCVRANGGASSELSLRVEVDRGCQAPLPQRQPLVLPTFPLVAGTSGIGAAAPTGTAGAPFRSLTRGISAAAAAGCPVVALASGEHDPRLDLPAGEALVVTSPVVLHGGHDPAAAWAPRGPATLLRAGAGSITLAAENAGLSELSVDGDCGGAALLGVLERAVLERVTISRAGRICLRSQRLIELSDGVQLQATGCSLDAGGAPSSTGILLGADSKASLASCTLSGGGPGFEGITLLAGASARLEGSSVSFSGTLGDATGIHALPGSTLTLVKSLVAAESSANVIGLWIEGARATVTDSAVYAGSGSTTVGLFAGPGSEVEVFGGVLRGGTASRLAAGALVDAGRLTIRRADESPDAGSGAPPPIGVTSPTPLLSGGQAPGAVSVGLAECAGLSGCTSTGTGPGLLDVRRAVIAGVDYEDGLLAPTGVAVAVALASGAARLEDSVLVAEATAGSGVAQGAAVVSASADGPGDLLIHDALYGPYFASEGAAALVVTHGAANSGNAWVLGCLLWAGSAEGGFAAAIVRDDAAAGPAKLEASLFRQLSPGDLLLSDEGAGIDISDVDELNQLFSPEHPNGLGELLFSYPPLTVSGCEGCADAGWDGSEEDGLDFYGLPREGIPDVGPFELP